MLNLQFEALLYSWMIEEIRSGSKETVTLMKRTCTIANRQSYIICLHGPKECLAEDEGEGDDQSE